MFALPVQALNDRLRALHRRLHNMPEDMARETLEAHLEETWQDAMGKAERYAEGPQILEAGGHFSTMSLGNWLTVAHAAGLPAVPTRLAGVVDPLMVFDIARNGVSEKWMAPMQELLGGVQDIRDDQIVRFDACATAALKGAMTEGRGTGDAGAPVRGWRRTEAGVVMIDLADDRLVHHLMENPANASPVWVRDWVSAAMRPGDPALGLTRAAPSAAQTLSDEEAPAGERALYPCEWRVFVQDGRVIAVGNYYPQIHRGMTADGAPDPDDAARARRMAGQARDATDRVLAVLRDHGAIPHHPKYEMRDGFDPDGMHFSLDFIEVADDDAPDGRRLMLLEGGPAHLRAPNWGAHPVSFGLTQAPRGYAPGLDDVQPLTVLDADTGAADPT